MTILVIAEHDNQSIKVATLNAVTAAATLRAQLATEIHMLVVGNDCGAAVEAAAKVSGVAKVRVAAAAHYAAHTAENVAALVVSIARGITRTSS